MGICHTYSVLSQPVYGLADSFDLPHIPAYGFRKVHYRLRAGEEGIVAAQHGSGRRMIDWLLECGYLHSPSKNNGSIVAEY